MADDLHDDDDIEGRFDGFFDDESPEVESPETTNDGAPPVASAETPAAADEAPERDDGRDARGRFAPKGGTAADSLDAPGANAADGAQPKTPGTPTPPADAALATVPPDPSIPDPNALDPASVHPLTIRVGQTDHAIPGAVVTPHGAVIPPESLQHLHEVYGRGVKYTEEREFIKREKAQLSYERDAHRAEVAPVMAEIDQIFGLFRTVASAPTAEAQQAAVEKLLEYGLTFAQNEPLLKQRMQFERERAEFQLTQRAQMPEPEDEAPMIRDAVHRGLNEFIVEAKTTEFGQLLTDDDWKRVIALVDSAPQVYAGRAGPQLTREEQAAGIQPGHLYLRPPAIVRQIQLIADMRREAKAHETQHQQALAAVKKAAEENSKRASAPKVGAPVVKRPTQAPKPPVEDDEDDWDDQLRRRLAEVVN